MRSVLLFIVAHAAGCGSFRESDPGPPDGAAFEAAGDATSAAGSDAGACRGGRDAGFYCGNDRCSPTTICCLTAVATCVPMGACPVKQRNCASAADCEGSKICCLHLNGESSECLETCPRPILCAEDAECGQGSRCVPPNATVKLWHCEPCPK